MNYIIILIGVLLVIIIFSTIIGSYNRFKKLEIKIHEADSGIDVALAKRYDVITQMVEVVKGYMKHESKLLIELTKLRSGMSISDKTKVNNKMNDVKVKIIALSENNPELKSSDNFLVLQKTLVNVEEHLAASRRMYNSNVTEFNSYLETFPSNIMGKFMSLKKYDYFEVDIEKEEQVKVEV